MEKYNRVRKIGEGAFGRAVLVRTKESGQQYVIKEINIGRMTAKEREEARKEVAVLAQLKHPNIVTYQESFEERGILYIVMDYCSGGDLYGKINNQRGLLFQEDQVWNWFVQICLAIKHIHDRKILHRDIKSQNIFLRADGRVQVGDFGIAKVLNNTVELARTCIGTPYYLSPEIVENKPYNNKSDIWSLGCVLYELATLKHAFEAGNMKNLVLKIIRGSYPPIPPKYSYELRGLIAQLFKRMPRDRPSINSILKKNFIISRVRNLLPEEKMQEEFSHTLLHGQKIARALPPPPRPASAGPKRVTPSPRPGSAAGRYNPAKVYGAPLARKSKEGKIDVRRKSGGKPVPGQQDWERRKQELIQKENKRREELKKKEQDLYLRQHKELVDKQKIVRMNKAREEGWRNLVDGVGDSVENIAAPPQPGQMQPPANRPLPMPNVVRQEENKVPLKDRGNYDQYNSYLNKIQVDRNARVREPPPIPRNNAGDYMAAPRPAQQQFNKVDRDYFNRAVQAGQRQSYDQIKQAEENRRAAAAASERARLAEEFLQRKRQAEFNKRRGHAQMYGYTPPVTPVYGRPNSGRGGKPAGGVSARNREEQEYLEKLRQIREQNMKERRMLQGNMAEEKKRKNEVEEAEERKKKIDALRKQAEEWSQKKKQQLEQEKKEIMERMKAREQYMKQREEQQRGKPDRPQTPQRVNMKPAAAVPITGALHAIGAGQEPSSPERPKSAKQQKKDDILKRLNEKGQGRSQWEDPKTPDLAVQEDEVPDSARSKWGDAEKLHLTDVPLEQTASQMEATSAGDQVVRGEAVSPAKVASRNQWGKPGETVVGVLQKLPVSDATMTVDSNKSGGSTSSQDSAVPESPSSPPVVPGVSSGVGATITIMKKPVQKGTITIKAADDSKPSAAAKCVDADKADKTPSESTEKDVSGQEDTLLEEYEDILEMAEQESQDLSELIPEQASPETQSADLDSLPSNQDEQIEAEGGDFKDIQSNGSDSVKDKLSCDHLTESKEKESDETQAKSTDSDKERSSDDQLIKATSKKVQGKSVDVFPKPRLLPKPILPEELFVKAPEVIRSQGAGSLFEKVELEEEGAAGDSGDMSKASKGSVSEDGNKFVTKGITTGQFDMNDVGLLRTASEPDLSKLGRSESCTPALLSRHISMDLSVVQEDEDDDADVTIQAAAAEETGQSSEETSPQRSQSYTENREGSQSEDDDVDEEEEEEGDDDEDLMSVRATMQSLLLEEDDSKGSDKVKFSLCNDSESSGRFDTEGQRSVVKDRDDSQKGEVTEEAEEIQEEDQEEVKEGKKEENLEDEGKEDETADMDNDEDDEEEELRDLREEEETENRISMTDLFDDSDGETQFGDDDDEDIDLFSRLEQQRAELESALGNKLIEVYKAVQAMQEDEDANIEEGAMIAMKMLGKEHEHLYPKIFQLVISDTAYTEDNA